MCRLLAVEGSQRHSFSLDTYLPEFAEACEYQVAPDGSLQEDGCGVTFTVEDFDNAANFWQGLRSKLITDEAITKLNYFQDSSGLWHILYLSLLPIWQAVKRFPHQDLPMTSRLVVHARAASVSSTKDDLQFNQPHLRDEQAFAFNGSMKNANMREFQNLFVRAGKLDKKAAPTQKLMSLLQIIYEQQSTSEFPMVVALQQLNSLLTDKFSHIIGMNIVTTTAQGMYALCGTYQSELKNYYTLYAGKDLYCPQLSVVSSFPLQGQKLKAMKMGEVFYADSVTQQAGIKSAMI